MFFRYFFIAIFFSALLFAKETFHQVKSGDTLMTISNQYYGTHQCWQLILSSNSQLKSQKNLEIGDRILIPNGSSCKKITIPTDSEDLSYKPILKSKVSKTDDRPFEDDDGFISYDSEGKKIKKNIEFIPTQKKSPPRKPMIIGSQFYIQLASFPTQAEAQNYKNKLKVSGFESEVVPSQVKNSLWYRIYLGPFSTKRNAHAFYHDRKLKQISSDYIIIKR